MPEDLSPRSYARSKPVVTKVAAEELIARAMAHAEKIGKTVAIAVVDDGGFLVAFSRMDAANPAAAQIAIDKAYTAAVSHIATHKWQEIMANDEPLRIGAPGVVHRLMTFGGGQPIVIDGQVAGAIGSSGGHWTGDTEITTEALKLFE
ncbi:heme-binding protein [Pseudooceanicola sp. CBS1P-1]|uniref:Heme-binding protein n=1 Tax=Pseudooceanicola albus TaxID=2692189 RepID=A0A6L7G7G2_9RHOB|nr:MULTISPECIES: heme-binding protein [Pseudooceanicola]MBT9386831.1 heme-binding protein [Pseudooceanicola endophyticus]MXN19346.1 heme-binding protein [Pseudooceanicola albus]